MMLDDSSIRSFDKQIDKKLEERNDIKISAFRLLVSHKIKEQTWNVLEDGRVLILAKKENCIDVGNNWYSLRYNREDIYKTISLDRFNKIILYHNTITVSMSKMEGMTGKPEEQQ